VLWIGEYTERYFGIFLALSFFRFVGDFQPIQLLNIASN
jgi:hypothetical protein